MPNIIISEEDLTSLPTEEENEYVVLIPGKAKGDAVTQLVRTVSELDAIADNNTDDYKMASRLLKAGMFVLFDAIKLTGGSDTIANHMEQEGYWDKFTDRNKYNILFITSGTTEDSTDESTISKGVLNCAATRGDAVGIINIPKEDEAGGVSKITEYLKGIHLPDIERANGINEKVLSYGTTFTPRCTDGDSVTFTASEKYLTAFAEHINQFPAWFAFAGSQRGTTSTEMIPQIEYGEEDVNSLQNSTTKDFVAANPICNISSYGDIVWGNRTMLPNVAVSTDGNEGKLSATSFLNIRVMCCILKKRIYRACNKFMFEPNTDVLWSNFTAEIIPLLEEMKSNQGIEGYKITRLSTTQKGKMKAVIKIVPIEAVDAFDVNVQIGNSVEVY